ncbi:MAG: hypothetical protein FWG47_05950, partial [Propionibacteriaceae bacterium]|nr:hypothetical protein [Propionibacteriaceae bacterium]
MRACAAVEQQLGVPTVALISADFEAMGRAIAKASGRSDQAIAVYPRPGIIQTDDEDVFRAKVTNSILPVVVEALDASPEQTASSPQATATKTGRIDKLEIVCSGSFEEVQDYFIDQGWSDGLPIVPPTLDRINKFMAHTTREPDEVLGRLLPEQREATVWNVAIHGVMAGCRPEYMGVLLAVAEAISDPVFHIQDAGATPGWEPLIIVCGPVVEKLEFNCEQGIMRTGRQANSSIGRFLRLYTQNIAGIRIPPGATDATAIGTTFNVAMPEPRQAAQALGWQTTSEELGYGANESIVMVQSVRNLTSPVYSMGSTPDEHLEALAEATLGALRTSAHHAYNSGRQYPVILMNPPVAEVIANAGLNRDYIRKYL